MANPKIVLPGEKSSLLKKTLASSKFLPTGKGMLGLLLVLTAISWLATYEWRPALVVYSLGDIAKSDIASPVSFRFQDLEATEERREAARRGQPLICTLDVEPVERLQRNMKALFSSVSKTTGKANRDKLRLNLAEETGEDISERMINLLMDPAVQNLANNDVLPWLSERMREGVLSDRRVIADFSGGIVVHDDVGGHPLAYTEISDVAALREELARYINDISANRLVNRLILAILSTQIMPTLRPDFEATARSANDAVRAVRPVMQQVLAGEVIVRQGEKIGPAQLPKLQALLSHEGGNFQVGRFVGILLCSILVCCGLFISPTGKKLDPISQQDLLFIAFMVGFVVVVAKGIYLVGVVLSDSSSIVTAGAQAFAVPVAGMAALACTVFSTRRYFTINILLALFCTLINKGGLSLLVFYFVSATFGGWFTSKAQTRKEVVKSFLPLFLALLPLWLGATLAMGGDSERFYAEFPALILGVMLSLFLLLAMPPLVEMLFGFTTRFSLMELMNQEHPLLRKLMFNAPGTYHHCLVVSNMVETAAEAIGAQSLLCKVGALYHDIGKTDMPQYFVENQFRGENPHDRLTPTMSALVLLSHVKRGVELAEKHRLGKEITSIIREHHGNRVIKYFYQKALDYQAAHSEQGQVREEDFSYGGPRPSTRESALIMLADVVEASSRVLADPTPSRIKSHVRKMIRDVLDDGQLDVVDLTFKDLELVEESFTLILIGMFHKRIEYPSQKKSSSESARAAFAPPKGDEPAESAPPGPEDRAAGENGGASADYHAIKWLS